MMTSPSPEPADPGANQNDSTGSTSRRVIVVLSADLFFGMRIRASLLPIGYVVSIHGDAAAFASALSADDQRASLGLIDFNRPVDWSGLVDALNGPVPIIAFGPHKDIAGFRAAKEAGVTRAVANGEFTRSLSELVERYARSSDT